MELPSPIDIKLYEKILRSCSTRMHFFKLDVTLIFILFFPVLCPATHYKSSWSHDYVVLFEWLISFIFFLLKKKKKQRYLHRIGMHSLFICTQVFTCSWVQQMTMFWEWKKNEKEMATSDTLDCLKDAYVTGNMLLGLRTFFLKFKIS